MPFFELVLDEWCWSFRHLPVVGSGLNIGGVELLSPNRNLQQISRGRPCEGNACNRQSHPVTSGVPARKSHQLLSECSVLRARLLGFYRQLDVRRIFVGM